MNKFNVKIGSAFALVAVLANVTLMAFTPALAKMNDPEFDLALVWGNDTGLTRYNTEDAFMPMGTLTREQGAKFLSAFAGEVLGIEADAAMDCTFSDSASIDSTLAASVAMACGQGLLKGSNNMFMPTTPMTKAQFITALVRGLDGMMDETVSPWYNNYCTWAKDNGITKETNCSALDRPITRYEALLMLYRGRVVGGDVVVDPTDPTDPTEPTDPVVVASGEYSVSVSAESPKGTTLPGLAPAWVASFDVTADEAGKLSSLTLERIGLGSDKAIADVTLYINGQIASKTRGFESDGTREYTLTPATTLAAGETITIDVVARIGNVTGASNMEFNIAAIEVNGEAISPVTANKFRVGAVNASAVKVDVNGTDDTVQLGEKGVVIGEFDIENLDNDYNVMLDSITLKDDNNNIRSNFENFVLKFDGDIVGTVDSVDGKYLTFVFNTPLTIADGEEKSFEVLADPIAGIGDETKLIIDDVNYVMGHDAKYGYGLAVEFATATPAVITIDAGDVSLEKIKLPADQIREDRDGYVLAAADLTVNAGGDVELQSIQFTNTTATNIANIFSKIEVIINGQKEEVDVIGNTLTFSSLDMSIPTGKAIRIEVRGDTKSTLSGYVGSEIKLQLVGTDIVLEDLDEGKKITDITPSSLSFDKITVSTAAVNISKIVSKNIDVVAGASLELFEFQIETNDVSSAQFREFKLTSLTGFNKDKVTQVSLHTVDAAGTVSAAIKSWNGSKISNSGILTLDGLNTAIAASTTQKFVVKATVTSNVSITGTIQATADGFVVRDDENNTLTNASTFSTRVITIVGAGTLNVSSDSSVDKDMYIVAGKTSANVAAFKIKATNEDILIEDFAVTFNNGADFVGSVDKVELVIDGVVVNAGSEGTVSASDTSSVQINDVNFTLPKNTTKTVYLRLKTKTMGDIGTSSLYSTADFNFGLNVTDANGVTSNQDLTATGTPVAHNVSIVPVRISALALTDYDTSKLASPNQTIGKLSITADSWTNSKEADSEDAELYVKTVTLVCSANAGFTGAVNFALRGDSSELGTGTCSGNLVTFNLTGTDALLSAGETATYYVDLLNASFVAGSSVAIDYKGSANVTYGELNSASTISGLRFSTANLGSAFADNF